MSTDEKDGTVRAYALEMLDCTETGLARLWRDCSCTAKRLSVTHLCAQLAPSPDAAAQALGGSLAELPERLRYGTPMFDLAERWGFQPGGRTAEIVVAELQRQCIADGVPYGSLIRDLRRALTADPETGRLYVLVRTLTRPWPPSA